MKQRGRGLSVWSSVLVRREDGGEYVGGEGDKGVWRSELGLV